MARPDNAAPDMSIKVFQKN